MKRIKFSLLIALALSLALNAAPVAHGQAANPTECLTAFDPEVDYFPHKVEIAFATGFEVTYHKHYKVVRVTRPWAGAESGFTYVLVQCGAPAPADEQLKDALVVEVPIKKFISMSTTYLPHLVELGVLEALVGVDTLQYVSTPEVVALGKAGKLVEIGSGAQVNIEQVALSAPDLIMTYGSGFSDYDAHPKLIEAGYKVALNGEFAENTPLGRAEWIKFTALFFNAEERAEAYFDSVASEYQRLVALTERVSHRPSVLINTPYQDVWYMPGGKSFAARFLLDAGASYAWADDESTGSLPLSIEDVFAKAGDAEFWVNVGFFGSLKDLEAADARFAEFAAFKNGKVFNNDKRTNENFGNDYFESGVIRPQVILADLIKIFHPELLPDHELVYYRQLE
ncbi:MAG: ABC transporter substrate-binding protein [Candidatus Thermofonsia Clade 1 bacterium]|jgi:iron complex transport system substrate-binding protein|uniref:ABC transporter substrate-binding protein n=1 Tax=Candidatus Thermofonsia Clade 1 bacterium TaxID=2364210 RepID=A0A2M8PHA6_9CHLR|nr:MAG: ABC transporter substrate-binding protein [Candidatus Thermofonsia Clade 1 bacterium]RMF51245.1 MAG: ABC transporter substrate-binding protein [Chloroflexota bacterium]